MLRCLFVSIIIVMPNQSGNTKRKKRNKKRELLTTSDATSTGLPCSSGLEVPTSRDEALSESKEDPTG